MAAVWRGLGHMPTHPNLVSLIVPPQKEFEITVIEASYNRASLLTHAKATCQRALPVPT
jgi:hypothetical protein